ncbi:MAG: lysophospholipase [Lachnospiraceae bacterium]|nr:lysophospholipase [Lachnospiraceae bacterium]
MNSEQKPQEEYIRSLFVARAEKEKKTKLERYRHLNPLVRPGQILLAGSSLMEYFPVHELLEDRKIRLPLAVYNRGIAGFTTAELLESMDECVYALEPSKIFLNIGTNDMNGPAYTEEGMIGNYRKILTGIRERLPEVRLYLMAYYPVCPQAAKGHPTIEAVLQWRTKERIAAANEAVRRLAAEFGAAYIDCNAGITDENGFLKAEYAVEGLHMYGDGYAKVLDALLPYLE